MSVKITKASGETEVFDEEKLKRSLMRSGASEEAVAKVIKRVLGELEPYAKTQKIYRIAKKHLKRYNHASGLRYSLKRAVMRLGPTGYPFEKYFGEVLKNHGYEVQVGVTLEGTCVSHEVDVFAFRDGEVTVSECKYHNSQGKATDVKTALYVKSRFDDLRSTLGKKYPDREFSGCLVTNTRCTSDAIDYARCAGFRVISWGYPSDSSLQQMIEDRQLYPVTIVSGIQTASIVRLFEQGIILLKDLLDLDSTELQSLLSIPPNKAELLKKQARALCTC